MKLEHTIRIDHRSDSCRAVQIERLRRAIKAGTYSVSSTRLAEKLIQAMIRRV